MKQPGMDPEFEAFCRARKMRRRKSAAAPGPDGHGSVWSAIEANEASDLQDRMLNAEVDDFFADATRIAATIVKRVAHGREQELTDQLRHDMEDFLAESIRRASNLMQTLPPDAESIGEAEVGTNLKNLGGKELDGFRAEGTAQLVDKHLGQTMVPGSAPTNPAILGDDSPAAAEAPASDGAASGFPADDGGAAGEDEDLSWHRLQIREGELDLDFHSNEGAFEPGPFADQISGLGAIQPEHRPMLPPTLSGVQRAAQVGHQSDPEDDLPLAALFDSSGAARTPAPEAGAAVDASVKRRWIRQTLLDLVHAGVLTEEQARDAYQTQTESL